MPASPRFFLVAILIAVSAGCGYHRLDRQPRSAAWAKQGETIRLARFRNLTPRLGLEDRFTKALENRIVAASPWRLVGAGEPSRWVLQGTLEGYTSRPLGLSLGNDRLKASAGSASRVEVAVVASVELLDGQTGAVVLSRRPGWLRIIITFLVIIFGWVIFRSDNLDFAHYYLRRMFMFTSRPNEVWLNAKFWTILAIGAVFAFWGGWKQVDKWISHLYDRPGNILLIIMSLVSVGLLVLSLATIASSGFNPFIYFRF